jgi:hypothetical protein
MRKSLFIALFCALTGLGIAFDGMGADAFTVTGIGYPPIRAVNEAQALIMARRAAMLDAYAHALYENVAFEAPESDTRFYRDFSGFIQGMAVTEESYLSDGAVKVVLRRKKTSPLPDKHSSYLKPQLKEVDQVEGFRAPRPISRDEWSHIIEKIVIFTDEHVQEMK